MILETTVAQPKKMVIYLKAEDAKKLIPLRAVTVHPTFEGIGTRGEVDFLAFRALAKSLVGDFDGLTHHITVMDL